MSKFSYAGILAWVIAGFVVIYQGISAVMGVGDTYVWRNIFIEDLISPENLTWIDSLPSILQHAMVYLLSVPFFVIMLVLGGLFFLISSFYKG